MIQATIRALRPVQWVKNLLVFAGLIFARRAVIVGAQGIGFAWDAVSRSVGAFVVFCLVSSATYLLNDIRDREADRIHPMKRHRPIAAGQVPVSLAASLAVLLYGLGLAGSLLLTWRLAAVILLYIVLSLAYSFGLKRVVILDVLVVALGFVLRAYAGTVVIDVTISVWLFMCTILLALFLTLTKRRAELVALAKGASGQRAVLAGYSSQLLDQMISVVTASTVVSYAIYTVSPSEFHRPGLVLTVPLVIFGIFRYLYLVYQHDQGEEPERLLFRDVPSLVNILLWLVVAGALIYLS